MILRKTSGLATMLGSLLLAIVTGCSTTATDALPSPSASSEVQPPAPPILEPDSSASATARQARDDRDAKTFTTSPLLVDPRAERQTMTGLGINANIHSWKDGQIRPAIDQYTALGPLVWRVIIEKADWERAQVGRPDEINDTYYRGIYESAKMRDLWNTISYIEQAPGQTVSLSIMGGVPEWMGGNSIKSESEDYWVRMIASLLDYGRRVKGLRLNLISPFNESDWNGIEGPQVSPEQMTSLLSKLSRRLDAMGMADVRFVVPDTASPQAARDKYMPALLANREVSLKIARIGIHTYAGDTASVPTVTKDSGVISEVWVTEFNAPCDRCDDGSEQADTWSHAFSMARDLLGLIAQGVNGAQLYDAWDGYYEHHQAVGYWGALKYDPSSGSYNPRQSFNVLALFLRTIQTGAVHVDSKGAEALTREAFVGGTNGRLSVVGANTSGVTQRFLVKVPNQSLSHPQLLVSKSDTRGVSADTPPVEAGGIVISVPPNAIFGLTATLS